MFYTSVYICYEKKSVIYLACRFKSQPIITGEVVKIHGNMDHELFVWSI